jgi:MoaA/NifB/PqqE/SkfB family radical SAM enzyme
MKNIEDSSQLVLDYHKLGGHIDRVEAWEAGERIAPVSVDMSLTRACGAMCSFCYAMVQESQERSSIKELHALNLLDDFKAIGVRSVSLVSDGESTLAKAYIPFIKHAKEIGIDVANGTNAWEWDQDKIEEVLPCLTWVRFTVAAGTPDRYASMMYKTSKDVHVFDRAMKNISYAVDLKKRKNLSVTLGIQMVLMPNMENDIVPFAQLGLALGVDYAVIKHCSDDEVGSLGIDYKMYESMFEKLKLAESMSNEKTKIIVKWNKINDGQNFPYKRVHGPQFLLQISGSGLVAPAGVFFNSKFSKFHIGNFTEERFKDIWSSERYWRVMRYLASDSFDPQRMMGSLPIAHYVNIALDRHIKGIERIKDTSNNPPLHHNFL